MAKVPKIEAFLDAEEKAIFASIERDDYKAGKNALTPERLKALQGAARATMNGERAKISLLLSKTDLERLKAKALREGMPYQTLINSILHKAVSG